MTKKYMHIVFLLIFAFTLTGCNTSSVNSTSDTKEQQTQEENSIISSTKASTKTEQKTKTAVVYFSATGTTAEVAQLIAKNTGGDIFQIIPDSPYLEEDLNYNDDNCRANREMKDDMARPAISGDLSHIFDFDVVYLGYPIWWGTAPRIIQTFLESYDLSKETIYTF